MRRLHTLCLSALMVLGACTGGAATKQEEAVKAAPTPAPTTANPIPPEPPPASDLPNAEELLAKVVEASGGAAKLDAIDSFYQEMTVEILGAGISGTGRTWSKGDDFYLEISLPGVGVSTGGGKAGKMWTLDPIQGLRELSGKEAAMAEMGTSLNIAHDWKRFFDKAETVKVEEADGKKFAEVTLTAAKSGNTVTLRIDLADNRIVTQRLKQFSSMGEIPVEVALSDYRQQDGVWFAFEQVADMKLQKLKTTTTKLVLNLPVDESKFAMPGSEPPPADAKADGKAPAKQ